MISPLLVLRCYLHPIWDGTPEGIICTGILQIELGHLRNMYVIISPRVPSIVMPSWAGSLHVVPTVRWWWNYEQGEARIAIRTNCRSDTSLSAPPFRYTTP